MAVGCNDDSIKRFEYGLISQVSIGWTAPGKRQPNYVLVLPKHIIESHAQCKVLAYSVANTFVGDRISKERNVLTVVTELWFERQRDAFIVRLILCGASIGVPESNVVGPRVGLIKIRCIS